jgi:hypothetical protein
LEKQIARENRMERIMEALLVAMLAAGVANGQGDKPKPAKSSKGTGAMKDEATKTITGQCHCGQVKYQAKGAVIKSSYCDCRGCQRATATLKAPFVTVLRADFTITAGKPTEYRCDSKAKCDVNGEWNFCPKCGTQVFWKGHKGKELDIFAGTLHNTALFQPKE